jgi:flagellar biosynthesis protein FlhA
MAHALAVEIPKKIPMTDIALAFGVVFILAILFLPIPAALIDFGLACSLSLSVLILMVALWIVRPLDFSAFPLVLLIVTMLRLSLNIATTRTILSHGHEGVHAAGYVISGFSRFVMGGDFVIGIVVFLVLVIVNFVVITKGATRIAEVGARFTLDAIPGKQMSIDADLSAGIIDEKEAQGRRRELEEESAFFGSMDGASKFVRGEAVAGLIILAINIFGGMIVGYVRHGMSLGEAADVFIKLSVGDGLVAQIPALIVSLAAGMLVSKGGTRGSVDKAVFGQLGAHPRALFVAAFLLFLLSITPGMPTLPFFTLSLMMAAAAQTIMSQRARSELGAQNAAAEAKREKESADESSVKSSLKTAEIELVLGKQLSAHLLPLRQELGFRMSKMRKKFASQYGFVVPEVRMNEDLSIPGKSYQIKIHGTGIASFELRIGEILALAGEAGLPDIPCEEVKEPAFGMRSFFVSQNFEEDLKRLGAPGVDNMGVILTHLSEVVRNNPQLLSYTDMKSLVERLDPEYRKLTDEICSSHISYPGLQAVLKLLLAERVSIRNLHLVIEAIAEVAPHLRRSEKIAEHVRMRIAQQLCGDITENGVLHVLRLGHRWDLAFHEAMKRDAKGEIAEFDMNPRLLEEFGTEASRIIKGHVEAGKAFAVITAPDARPYVRMVIERLHPSLPVLSHAEIAKGVELRIIGSIS